MTATLADQTRNAFDFIEKLYLEISFLIKDLENQLSGEPEQFQLGRTGGYAITTMRSSGLDASNVRNWFPRHMAVFFVPGDLTSVKGGQTVTALADSLKLLLLHITVHEAGLKEPEVLHGTVFDIRSKKPDGDKVEKLMSWFVYYPKRVFSGFPTIAFEDGSWSFKGLLGRTPLFTIHSSDDIRDKLVKPMLETYRR